MKKLQWEYPGPGIGVSCHNHTLWSDGGATVETMCRSAKAAGVREFGISDHWVEHPGHAEKRRWWVEPARLDDYVAEVLKWKARLDDGNFTVRLGMEVDFFFENIEEVMTKLSAYPFDYLIGAVHYAGDFPIDGSADNWKPLSSEQIDEICECYYTKLEAAAKDERFSWIAHLDLPKKFGFLPDPHRWFPHACRVLDAVQKHGGAIEVNTSGMFKTCAEVYPAPELLREAAARRIPVVISADAHAPEHIRRFFPEAAALLVSAGCR